MNKPRIIVATLSFLIMMSVSNGFAQPERQVEPSFEIVLQILAASNDAGGKGDLPDSLSAIAGKLKKNFALANLNVVSTYLERIANRGSLNFRTALYGLNQVEMGTVSSNWAFDTLTSSVDPAGRNVAAFRTFVFEAEFPYKTSIFNEKNGGMIPATGADSIVLKNQNLSVPENEPTLIGTLAVPKSDRNIFLIITVKRL